jgi:hypothetical protein
MLRADDVKVTHFSPGRLRLKVPAIRGRAAEAEVLGSAIRSIPGIKTLEISTVTGSLLITYDVVTLASDVSARQLRTLLQEHLPSLDSELVLQWIGVHKPLI